MADAKAAGAAAVTTHFLSTEIVHRENSAADDLAAVHRWLTDPAAD